MRKTGLLAIVGFLLFSAAMFADETRGAALPISEQDVVKSHSEALEGEALSTDAVSAEISAETAEARDWDTRPEWAGFIRPTPPPNYCPACQPCTATIQCGLDPHNGSSLGVCSPPPNSWCPGTTTSVCICY